MADPAAPADPVKQEGGAEEAGATQAAADV
jgi:hypothetical protein